MKKSKRGARTNIKLKQVVLDMLGEVDFSKITVTEICNRAAISKSTFYAHFFDKYELADELINDYIIKFRQYVHLRFLSIDKGSSLEVLKQVISEIVKDSRLLSCLTKIEGIRYPLNVQLQMVLFEESSSFFEEKQRQYHYSSEFLATMYTNFALASIMLAIENKHQASLISQQVKFMNQLQDTLLDKL